MSNPEPLMLLIPSELYELLEKEALRRKGSVSQACVAVLREAMQPLGALGKLQRRVR